MALDASIITQLNFAGWTFRAASAQLTDLGLVNLANGLCQWNGALTQALTSTSQDIATLKAQAPHYGTLSKQLNRIPGQ
jgi:hypothetical protein